MELVNLAHIVLNRIGTASSSGFGFRGQQRRKFIAEVADAEIETLHQMVIDVAEANGESAGALHDLRLERSHSYSHGLVVFDVQRPNIQYGSPYAECQVIPALKVGERYFQLEEVDARESMPFRPDTKAE